MCKTYGIGCDHSELPHCVECEDKMTVDGHEDTAMAALQGGLCMPCYKEQR